MLVFDHALSALQRAEIPQANALASLPWEITTVSVLFSEPKVLKALNVEDFLPSSWMFQCSSASRNSSRRQQQRRAEALGVRFSALQRAEIPQVRACEPQGPYQATVSVLFSEPKFLKLKYSSFWQPGTTDVSVLFSEPKFLKLIVKRRAGVVTAR